VLGAIRRAYPGYAQAVTAMWWSFAPATMELAELEAERRPGRGRRPSVQASERLRKRQGVAFQSYDAALARLDELAAGNGHSTGPTLEESTFCRWRKAGSVWLTTSFRTLAELSAKLRRWEYEYNHRRPHLALAGQTPAERVCELKITARPVQAMLDHHNLTAVRESTYFFA
jgi:transposase InsO family protein